MRLASRLYLKYVWSLTVRRGRINHRFDCPEVTTWSVLHSTFLLLQVIDEHTSSRVASATSLLEQANVQVDILQRRCVTLRQENEAISDEYQRMEADMRSDAHLRRQLDERTAELIRFQTQHWSQTHDIQALTETNGILSANLVDARRETEKLTEALVAAQLTRDSMETSLRHLDQDLSEQARQIEELTAERDRFKDMAASRQLRSSHDIESTAPTHLSTGVDLRAMVTELTGHLEMRDSTIRHLREELEEQVARMNLMQSQPFVEDDDINDMQVNPLGDLTASPSRSRPRSQWDDSVSLPHFPELKPSTDHDLASKVGQKNEDVCLCGFGVQAI